MTALYVVQMRGDGGNSRIGDVTVRWADPRTREPREERRRITVEDVDVPLELASPWLMADITSARLALALRDRSGDFESIAAAADEVARRTENPDIAELAEFAHAVRQLAW